MDEVAVDDVRVLARGTGIAVPGQVLGRLLTFLGLAALARMLGPATFGHYAVGWTVLKVGALVAALGLPIGGYRNDSPLRCFVPVFPDRRA